MSQRIKKIFVIIMFVFFAVLAVGCNFSTLIDAASTPTITITGDSEIGIGESFTAIASISPADKFNGDITWSSTDEDVIVITSDGVVTGVSVGRATVKATYEDSNVSAVGRFSVKVVKETIEYTDEAPSSISLIGKTEASINTLAYYHFSTDPINASQDVAWSSSDENVATVDALGIVRFVGEGSVTITVSSKKDNKVKGTKIITVTEKTRDNDLETATINCIAETKNSILGVANYVYNKNEILEKSSIGSGFVYYAWGYLSDGTIVYDLKNDDIVNYGYYLITNKHVVKDADALKIYIHMIDEEVDASLVQYDDKVDLAIVQFDYDEYIAPLEFASSDDLVAGQYVVAIGNPEGFNYSSSATQGIVSYPIRYISDDTDGDGVNDWDAAYIQHDAAINPGNSGGPLLNLLGQVVGINTMKFASTTIDNMGFSIPSQDIVDLLPYLENGKVPVRAKIGVTIIAISDLLAKDYKNDNNYNYQIPDNCKTGLYVTTITSGSVADGKIQADDIITEFNGVQLKNSLQLRAELNAIVVGSNTEVLVKLLRNGIELEVTLIW